MINVHKEVFLSLILYSIFLAGCVSQPNCIKTGNFCGMIIDENNKPVNNYLIICNSSSLEKKKAYTNRSGIFVIPDMSIGEYELSGQKVNYSLINKKIINFNGSNEIFCCQVLSLEKIINQTNIYIKNKDFEKALECLSSISPNDKELNSLLILLYQSLVNLKQRNLEDYNKCMKSIKKLKNEKCKEIIKKGELKI